MGAILVTMLAYVNHQAMGDLFRPLEHESNPVLRVQQLTSLMDEMAEHLHTHLTKTCYDLKVQGWSTGAISDEVGVSERMVKRLITAHSQEKKVRNPLLAMRGCDVEVDITQLVNRAVAARQKPEDTTHPTA